ncbi:hypothetical protein HDU76_002626 [Blyttiomyces sp. JEL0837]|nr:hypothetical protein HDU76_002626 [Blyttiomyces sp. JEL0837]
MSAADSPNIDPFTGSTPVPTHLLQLNLTLATLQSPQLKSKKDQTVRFLITLKDSSAIPQHSTLTYTLILLPDSTTLYCIEAACPHAKGPLYRGRLVIGDIEDLGQEGCGRTTNGAGSVASLECPYHKYVFDLKTGVTGNDPLHPAKVLPVEVDNGGIHIRVPETWILVSVKPMNVFDDLLAAAMFMLHVVLEGSYPVNCGRSGTCQSFFVTSPNNIGDLHINSTIPPMSPDPPNIEHLIISTPSTQLLPLNLTLPTLQSHPLKSKTDQTVRLLITLTDSSTPNSTLVYTLILLPDSNTIYCIEADCPHAGGPLYKGPLVIRDIEDLDGKGCERIEASLECPYHHYVFDLKTGVTGHDPLHPAQVLPVEVENGGICVRVPETWTLVSVEPIDVTEKAKRVRKQVNGGDPVGPLKSEENWTLTDWAVRIMNEPDPTDKVNLTLKLHELWKEGKIKEIGATPPPDEPSRPEILQFIGAGKAKRIGKGGSIESRILILHSLANVEQWAIDLSLDAIARFATTVVTDPKTGSTYKLPRDYFSEFLKVAADEAKHFTFLVERLEALGSEFGALPVHASLWESAEATKESFLARMAIVHMVHEARGLDVNPGTIAKFERANDDASVEKLKIIHNDEVTHVATGQKWFAWACEKEGKDRYATFHALVKQFFRGLLKPPFNDEDRLRAGLDTNYYLPLSIKNSTPSQPEVPVSSYVNEQCCEINHVRDDCLK